MEAKNPQWGRVSSVNGAVGGNWTVSYKRMKLEPYLTPYVKINLKLIKRFEHKT